MYRLFVISCLILSLTFPCHAQRDLKNKKADLFKQLYKNQSDKNRVGVLNRLSNFYLFNRKSDPKILDTALSFAIEAEKLSRAAADPQGTEEAVVLRAWSLIHQDNYQAVKEMVNASQALMRLRLTLLLAETYLNKPGSVKNDLDSANYFIYAGVKYSEQLQLPRWKHRAQLLLAQYNSEMNNQKEADKIIIALLKVCRLTHDQEGEAKTLIAMAGFAPYGSELQFLQPAQLVYRSMGRTGDELATLKLIANANLQYGKLGLAEQQLDEVLKGYKLLNYANLQYTYDLLSAVSRLQGNFDKALQYAQDAVECEELTGSDEVRGYFYGNLANVYKDLGQKNESFKWYKKAIIANAGSKFIDMGMVRSLTEELIKQGKAKEAIEMLNFSFSSRSGQPSFSYADVLLGNCYYALKDYTAAEKYYLQGIKQVNKGANKDYNYISVYHVMGNFYVLQHQYEKAVLYLNVALEAPAGIYPPSKIAEVHHLLFQTDSAKSNLLSAITHFKAYKTINEQLFNEKKTKQIQELEVKYNLKGKTRDNQLLINKGKLQETELQKALLARKLTFLVMVALLLIIGLLYYGYTTKQKNNKQLKTQQEEINLKNENLVTLLDEKEWLVKEIHHRVKNNLQVIMSLLNTQSIYLDNTDALSAIRDSQNRLQSISLIHQKLYQSNNVAYIDIKTYIIDLVQYLCDTFGKERQLGFDFQIPSINVDVTQAVPLGLILNEAITNIMKYAYPNEETGQVKISITEEKEQFYVLKIEDNGKGLPDDFDLLNTTSLGMDLMQGLSDQLHGSFNIASNKGVTLEIRFSLLSMR